MSNLQTLRDLMRALRAPDSGCPWDRDQTFESIAVHTLEEAFEVADVIESGRLEELPSELGDLLFQVIFYCQLAEEEGRFSIVTWSRVKPCSANSPPQYMQSLPSRRNSSWLLSGGMCRSRCFPRFDRLIAMIECTVIEERSPLARSTPP